MKISYLLIIIFLDFGISKTYFKATYRNQKKFVLITSLYNETNFNRLNEYKYCMERNLAHPLIEEIHVFYDTSKDNDNNLILDYLKTRPVNIKYCQGRPTYEKLFELSNTYFENKNIILTNADIFFDETLHLLHTYDLTNKFLSLTRWDLGPHNMLIPAFHQIYDDYTPYGSDTWIFKSPLRKFQDEDFGLGTWGCDGILIYQAVQSGLTVINPCIHLRCIHVHSSNIRNYDLTYPTKKMAWIRASGLQEGPGIVVYIN